jgi:DNA-binding NarL/FixJ family response regulator
MLIVEQKTAEVLVPQPRTEPTPVTVMEDDEVVRIGLAAVLGSSPEYDPVAVEAAAPRMPPTRGLLLVGATAGHAHDAVDAIRHFAGTGASVILHTADEHPIPLRNALAEGASGVALHRDGVAGLLDVMHAVERGELGFSSEYAQQLCNDRNVAARLSAREADVMICLADGLTHRQVARRLGIDEETVKTHLKSVRAKYMALGRAVTNVGTLNREARSDGWIS